MMNSLVATKLLMLRAQTSPTLFQISESTSQEFSLVHRVPRFYHLLSRQKKELVVIHFSFKSDKLNLLKRFPWGCKDLPTLAVWQYGFIFTLIQWEKERSLIRNIIISGGRKGSLTEDGRHWSGSSQVKHRRKDYSGRPCKTFVSRYFWIFIIERFDGSCSQNSERKNTLLKDL